MKFDIYDLREIIKYIERTINSLASRTHILQKDELPFTIEYKGEYIKHVIKKGTGHKALYLEYFSSFIYTSKNASFHPIRKLYLRMYNEIPFSNKVKEKVLLRTAEKGFCEHVANELFAIMAFGRGCLELPRIIDGTAELGVNEKSTPLEIIKEQQDGI